MSDGNFQFLIKCKKYQQENRLKQLIISEANMSYNLKLTYEQIMASHYISALHDQIVNPNHFKQGQYYSLPISFALMMKAIKQQNYELFDRIITVSLKEQSVNCKNRHILLFNKTKILQMIGQVKNAAFYCERLLKQSGEGLDYYTSLFLMLLIQLGRSQQALKISQRHLKNSLYVQKQTHKIQSIYIYLLKQLYQSDQTYVLKSIQQNFNNKNLCLRNWYNIALLLKVKHPLKSLQLFKKILSHKNINQLQKLQYLTKINILNIYEEYYVKNINEINNKSQIKDILEQCQDIYLDLEIRYQNKLDGRFSARYNNIKGLLKNIHDEIKNQKNLFFYQTINFKNNQQKQLKKKLEQEVNYLSQRKPNQENEGIFQFKYYKQKKAQNQRKLQFLLKKQKQLKQFFNKIKVSRNGNRLNIKVFDKCVLNQSLMKKNMIQNQEKDYQTKYLQKKKKIEGIYQKDQINSILNNFIDDWVLPNQKQQIKLKNPDHIKSFVFTLDAPHQKQNQQALFLPSKSQINKSAKAIRSNRTSQQAFRVKNNTSRKNSDKMLEGIKYNDYMSNQMVNNLKVNLIDKQKQEKQTKGKKTFKQLLHEGEIYQSQNKLEEAHQIYAQMYKLFKDDKQKQILLLKIAQNYEKLSFISEAQKTYIKCSKYNNTQAFFKLGSLQVRNGQIEMGIQNLEKANCIQRNNTRIQIQLVYAYSLLQQTTQRALALANSILKRDPESLQALIMSSKILQKQGKIKQALEIAIAVSNTLGTASTYHFIGLLYLNESNVSDAFKCFQKALQCDPHHNPSLIELATITSQINAEQAIQILKNVLSSDPQNQLAFARLGKIYQTFQNDYQSALMIYKKGLEYSPTYQNYVKIGDCHFKLGYVMEAYLSYKQALNLKRTPQIYEKIAQVHENLHQDKKAVQVYVCALAELPKDNSNNFQQKKYLYKLGKLSLLNQDYEAAYGYLSELVEIEQNFQTFKLLGQTCFGKGDYKEALRYYSMAIDMQQQDSIQILENIAICLDKQQQYIASKQIYEKILSIEPKNIKCLNNLANILLILGKTNQAFYWFQFMLQQAPNLIEKRLRVSDIYATIGDWSKVQQHLMTCYKQKQNDIRVIQRLVNLYKEKRDTKQLTKFEKRLALLKSNGSKNN